MLQFRAVEFERWMFLLKDAIKLHYGKCRIQCFQSLTPIIVAKIQIISASHALIVTILF